MQFVWFWVKVMAFNTTFNNIPSFIGGGNRRAQIKPPTCLVLVFIKLFNQYRRTLYCFNNNFNIQLFVMDIRLLEL